MAPFPNRPWPTPQRALLSHPQLQALYAAPDPGCALIAPGSSGPAAVGGTGCAPGRGRIPGGAPRPRRLAARRVPAAEPGEERPRLS